MTTKNTQNVIYVFLLTLLVGLIPFGISLAQSSNLDPNRDVVVDDAEQSISEEVDSDSDNQEPWFRIEKLTGDNIQQGDFVVGPGRAEVEVKPGETITYEISVANRISDGKVFSLTVEDIGGTEDGSDAVILLGEEQGLYTVKDYITFPKDSFSLGLGDRARIPVTISIPPNADPGGYYGSVLVSTINTDDGEQTGAARSPIIARVGTLFFITVPGDINKAGETKEIALSNNKKWYQSGPIQFNILYENTGSTHLNPYGEIRIKNLLGEEVGFVELESWFVLPQSLRTRDVTWDRELLLGRYVTTAYINRGYDDIVDEVLVVFWVLPWKVVLGTFLVIFSVLFVVRAFFRRFEFRRKG